MTPERASGADPFARPPPRVVRDPSEVADERGRHTSRTHGRAELEARHPDLHRISPAVGDLDERAASEWAQEDPDAATALLADLAHATDARVRAAARRAALRIALRAPPGAPRPSGRPWLGTSADPDGADLDLDATLARLAITPRLRREDVRVRDWVRRGCAYVVLVDTSGSVGGARLAAGVLAAGAVATAMRPVDELAVVAFGADAFVLRPISSTAPPAAALDALLDLRGSGTTDVAHGLRAALGEAARAAAPRREILVLTDGLRTAGGDPLVVAATAGRVRSRLHVLALDDGPEAWDACRALAGAGGGRCAPLTSPGRAAAAIGEVLGAGTVARGRAASSASGPVPH